MVKRTPTSSYDLAEAAIRGIQEVKGHDILSIDLREIPNSVSDFFVICHGTSNVQVEAIARSVEKTIYKEMNDLPIHKEGKENAEWILLDYFNIVVHVFDQEAREFYNLEKLWADADVKQIEYQQ